MYKEKQKWYKKYIKNKNSESIKSRYNASKNVYFRKIKSTKIEFYQKHLDGVKNDVKGTWKVINSVLGRKKGRQIFKLSINGKEIKNETKIANEFNSHFSKVAEKLVKKIPKNTSRKRFYQFLGERNGRCIFLNRTTPFELLKILKSLPAKSSYGWDEIPQKLIKSSPFNVLVVLSHIFNLSIDEGIFPEKMKIAKVIPIFKEGKKQV